MFIFLFFEMKFFWFLIVFVLFFSGLSFWQTSEEDDIYVPWTSYCISVTSNMEAASSCLSCLAWWGMYYPAPGWIGPECWPMQTVCSEAYSEADKQAKCTDSYNECLNKSVSPDRCACKAIGGISLNTNVPFVGNCISLTKSSSPNTTSITDPTNAFPRLLAGLTKLVMTVVLIFCFMAIIAGGVLISMGGASEEQAKKGKDLIRHVVIALALLGASGVILRVINPSFFT